MGWIKQIYNLGMAWLLRLVFMFHYDEKKLLLQVYLFFFSLSVISSRDALVLCVFCCFCISSSLSFWFIRVSIRWYLLVLVRGLYRCFMIILNKNLWYSSVVFRLVIFIIIGSFCFVYFVVLAVFNCYYQNSIWLPYCISFHSFVCWVFTLLCIVPLFRFVGGYLIVDRYTLLVFWVIYQMSQLSLFIRSFLFSPSVVFILCSFVSLAFKLLSY